MPPVTFIELSLTRVVSVSAPTEPFEIVKVEASSAVPIVNEPPDILSDVFDGEITGSFILDIDSIESEPYESDYNPMTDEIIYDTSEIDEINVDWEFDFDEPDEVLIENNQLTESTQTSYNITYFLNSATANREPSTETQVKRDWKEITKTFKNDLSAFEYIVTDILEDDVEDIYEEYDDVRDSGPSHEFMIVERKESFHLFFLCSFFPFY